ncbi:MAG: choice-of-anchor P family protein [Microthrixaceae bacterium]
MRSPDPRRTTIGRRRRHLALLMGAAALLGMGGGVAATAQDAQPTGPTGDELFGVYQMEARGLGVQGTYRIEGLIPGDTPILDLALPETVARLASGPSGYGLASLAYPGGIIANFGTLVTQSGGPGDDLPPYPIKAEAFYPSGPTTAEQSQQGGSTQKVVTSDRAVHSVGSFPGMDAPPLVNVGSITSASRSSIDGELAVSRSRVVLGNVRILGGLITIESLTTDLVAAHNGLTGSTAGGTSTSGVRFLGLDAAFTDDGLVLKEAPPTEGPGAPLGGALGGAAAPLSSLTGPVQEQLNAVLAQATPSLDEVLARAGIHIELLSPRDAQVDSGAASRTTSGLSVTFSYEGREQEAMVELVNSIPPELKPNFGPIPNPVTFLAENHIYGLSLGPASVSALATPAFGSLDLPIDGDLPAQFLPEIPVSEITIDGSGFTTRPAPLPAPSAGSSTGEAIDGEPISNAVGAAVPAILVALALLLSPLFGLGSSRLADNVLAPVTTSCPIGLDEPPAPPRPS